MATNPSAGAAVPTPTPGPTPTLWQKPNEVLIDLLPEAFATFLLLLIIGAAQRLLHSWIGDYKFYGVLPISWVFDTGDLVVISYFIVRNLRKIVRG